MLLWPTTGLVATRLIGLVGVLPVCMGWGKGTVLMEEIDFLCFMKDRGYQS